MFCERSIVAVLSSSFTSSYTGRFIDLITFSSGTGIFCLELVLHNHPKIMSMNYKLSLCICLKTDQPTLTHLAGDSSIWTNLQHNLPKVCISSMESPKIHTSTEFIIMMNLTSLIANGLQLC